MTSPSVMKPARPTWNLRKLQTSATFARGKEVSKFQNYTANYHRSCHVSLPSDRFKRLEAWATRIYRVDPWSVRNGSLYHDYSHPSLHHSFEPHRTYAIHPQHTLEFSILRPCDSCCTSSNLTLPVLVPSVPVASILYSARKSCSRSLTLWPLS